MAVFEHSFGRYRNVKLSRDAPSDAPFVCRSMLTDSHLHVPLLCEFPAMICPFHSVRALTRLVVSTNVNSPASTSRGTIGAPDLDHPFALAAVAAIPPFKESVATLLKIFPKV